MLVGAVLEGELVVTRIEVVEVKVGEETLLVELIVLVMLAVVLALVGAAAAGPNSRILLFPVSETHRLPEESSVMPHAPFREP